MNPAASPYWNPQGLPVLEAPPDGAESSGGGGGGMMPPVQQQGQIHPGQLRPISAATGYAVSSDFVAGGGGGGSGGGGDGCANGDAGGTTMNSMNSNNNGTMMVQPDASGHHHYDRHHRQAVMWPGGGVPAVVSMAGAMHQQQHQHLNGGGGGGYPPHFGNSGYSGYEYSSGGGGGGSSPGGNYGYSNYSDGGGGYFHGDGHNGHHHDDYDFPLAQSRGGGGHGNNHNRIKMDAAQMQKRLLRDPAVRSAYWRLQLSLATRADPQDRATNASANANAKNKNNPYAARDMANPTKAEAWLAAIGAAEVMAQKKSTDTSNSTGAGAGAGAAGRRRNKKNRHQGHNDNHEYRKRRGPNRKGRGSQHSSNEGSEDSIDNKLLAAGYLKHLLQQLNDDKPYWDDPPRFRPTAPNWDEEGLCQAALIVENVPGASLGMAGGVDGDYYDDDPYMDITNNQRGGRFGGGNGDSNRYSVFGDDDDSDGDDDEQESIYGSDGENCEHGDAKSTPHSGGSDTSSPGDLSEEEIVYRGDQNAHQQRSRSKSKSDPNPEAHMATRRIVVRVLAALGDVHSLIGISHSQAKPIPRWVRGASQYAFAFRSLTIGQELLDGQYAEMLQAEEEEEGAGAGATEGGDDNGNDKAATITTPRTKARLDKLKAALATDSDIIAVSLTSFVRNRDRYLNAAKSRIEFLQGRLLEDRERREEAFNGMGQERWENNPSPRCDYSEQRKKMERELRQAKEGCERVSKLDAKNKDKSEEG